MWPWEHVLFAYVCYSLYVHGRHGHPPRDKATVVLAFGSVLPDLIDKPLAWQFDLFETGYAVAHSVFAVLPVLFGVYMFARRRQEVTVPVAFIIGYLLHLIGDLLPASLSRGTLTLSPVLWPISNWVPVDTGGSLTENTFALLTLYVSQLVTLEPTPVVVLQLGSVLVGTALWLWDGCPGLAMLLSPNRR